MDEAHDPAAYCNCTWTLGTSDRILTTVRGSIPARRGSRAVHRYDISILPAGLAPTGCWTISGGLMTASAECLRSRDV
jgi:hypothetical protein